MTATALTEETLRWWQRSLSDWGQRPTPALRTAWVWCWCRAWETLSSTRANASPADALLKHWQTTLASHQSRFHRAFPESDEAMTHLLRWLSSPAQRTSFADTLHRQRAALLPAGNLAAHWLGPWYEETLEWDASTGPSSRKAQASHYTPAAVARRLVESRLAGEAGDLPRVCDPAAGGGAFLLAALEQGSRTLSADASTRKRWVETRVYGVDLDPLAIEVCRLALWYWSDNPATDWTRLDRQLRAGHGFLGVWSSLSPALPLPSSWKGAPDAWLTAEAPGPGPRTLADLRLAVWIAANHDSPSAQRELPTDGKLATLERWARELLHPWRPFHWELEFPEIFVQGEEQGGFDLVLSNPPFGNAIEREQGLSATEKEWARLLAPEATRGAFDRAAVFAQLVALRLCRPRGRYTLILPRSLLDGVAAKSLQQALYDHARPDSLWLFEDPRLFASAHLFLCALQGRRGAEGERLSVRRFASTGESVKERPWSASASSWWSLTQDSTALCPRVPTRPLGELCEVFAGCSTEAAYTLAPLVEEASACEGDDLRLRLINTGLIDRYTLLWGDRPVRYLKRRFASPLWPALTNAPPSVQRAGTRQQRPKLLIGGLTKVLEACLDPTGLAGGVVSTWALWLQQPEKDRQLEQLSLLEVVLNSLVLSRYYQQHFGAQQSPWGGMTIRKRGLLALPLPPSLWNDNRQCKGLLPSRPWDASPEQLLVGIRTQTASLQLARACSRWQEVSQLDETLQPWLSALYGLTEEDHERLLEWGAARKRVKGRV